MMGRLAERLNAITLHASDGHGGIWADVAGRGRDVRLTFAEGVYDNIDEQVLSGSLERICRVLWNEWQRHYLAATNETALNVGMNDQHDRNFFIERDRLMASGQAANNRMVISSVGMKNFSVYITPGSTRIVPEEQVSSDFAQAVTALIEDYRRKTSELKERYYGVLRESGDGETSIDRAPVRSSATSIPEPVADDFEDDEDFDQINFLEQE